ncbi:transferrin-binding protein-like solute binding protein [Moraxella nonliquefaciens]|jgi:lipoprotein GNA1870 C terminal like|uniref:factor H binding protein domain-containing protein n=1 Tax=Moraxella nonliquefaciens TaxID=478 RepID=UPI001EF5E66C|nr:factor H binding protein domain-containing protein [Moraxella nonliquefaciens]MCG7411358.1 transferrin-binding protein-like solute binding protein [Moraxella nonliquefaciens]
MKVKQITLGSSTLVLAALLTACGGSSSSGVQKPTHLVGHGHHGHHDNHDNHDNHGNHGTTNPSTTVSYAFLQGNATKEAKNYVHRRDGVVPEIIGYTLSVDGKTQDGGIDLSKYPKGHSTLNVKETVTAKNRGYTGSVITDSVAYLFQQEYSSIIGFHNKNVTTVVNGDQETKPVNRKIDFLARGTPTEKLPTTGKFNYSGSGKVRTKDGIRDDKFSYNVDFGAKTGSGSLGNITLSEGKIKAVKHDDDIGDGLTTQVIFGKATDGSLNGDYGLGFYGPHADEIAGSVELGDKNDVIGVFGGTKQAK